MALDGLDALDAIGIDKTKVSDPDNAYQNYLNELVDVIVAEFKLNPEDKGLYSGSAILQSIVPVPGGALKTEIVADEYFTYIDEGVDGLAPEGKRGAPFSFKNPNPHPEQVRGIKEWIPKRGYFLPPQIASFDSFAYAIALGVKQRGIEAKNIVGKTLTDEALDKITTDLQTITGLNVNFIFQKAFKPWQ